MDIQIQNLQNTKAISLPSIRLFLEKCLDYLDLTDAELSVLFIDDEKIRQLNRRYRGLDRPTDVLAFSMQEGEGPAMCPNILGDIVISVETASRQGEEVGWGMEKEIYKLLTHGLLHLIGFDHETNPTEALRMQDKEEEVMKAAGIISS
jgi:probable rRNA maturation factor